RRRHRLAGLLGAVEGLDGGADARGVLPRALARVVEGLEIGKQPAAVFGEPASQPTQFAMGREEGADRGLAVAGRGLDIRPKRRTDMDVHSVLVSASVLNDAP